MYKKVRLRTAHLSSLPKANFAPQMEKLSIKIKGAAENWR